MEKDMTGIGPRLRQERTRLKLSQSALGSIGGVETNAQGNYESGNRSPKADYLLRVMDAGVDIHYVLTGKRLYETEDACGDLLLSDAAKHDCLDKVTRQLQCNLAGLIDALYKMTLLVESKGSGTEDDATKTEREMIRKDAQELAQASVRLIFATSKLT